MITKVNKVNGEIIISFFCSIYFIFLYSTVSNAGYSISCSLMVLGSIIWYVKKKKLPTNPPACFCGLYILFVGSIMAASCLFGEAAVISKCGKFISYSLPVWIIYISLLARKHFHVIVETGCVGGALILSGYGLYCLFFSPWGTRAMGPFSTPNNFAMVLEMLLPFLVVSYWYLYKKDDLLRIPLGKARLYIAGIATVLSILSILLTQSRGGIAGALFSGIVVLVLRYIFLKYKLAFITKIGAFLLILCIFAGSIAVVTMEGFARHYDKERILLLKSTYQMWEDHKLYGVGWGNWQKEYRKTYISKEAKEPNLPLPHNNTATFFSTTGAIGGLGYLIFSIGTIVFLIKKIDEQPDNYYLYAMLWVCLAVFAHGMVDNSLYGKYTTRIFFGMWGITLVAMRKYMNIDRKYLGIEKGE